VFERLPRSAAVQDSVAPALSGPLSVRTLHQVDGCSLDTRHDRAPRRNRSIFSFSLPAIHRSDSSNGLRREL
jgi:hypothetical protein